MSKGWGSPSRKNIFLFSVVSMVFKSKVCLFLSLSFTFGDDVLQMALSFLECYFVGINSCHRRGYNIIFTPSVIFTCGEADRS